MTAARALTPQMPTTASNVCTTDARMGGVGRGIPPPTPINSYLIMKVNYDVTVNVEDRKIKAAMKIMLSSFIVVFSNVVGSTLFRATNCTKNIDVSTRCLLAIFCGEVVYDELNSCFGEGRAILSQRQHLIMATTHCL